MSDVLVRANLYLSCQDWACKAGNGFPFYLQAVKKYEFIIPDWRGFGGSKDCAIPETDAISSHWNDLDTLIKQLKLDQFILIGYSMGATTAMHRFKHGGLAQKLKAYLHIDQTPKIPVDDSWQYGLFGQKHEQFKSLLLDIQNVLSENRQAMKLEDLATSARDKLVKA